MKFYRVCHRSLTDSTGEYHAGPYMTGNFAWGSHEYRVADSLGWAHVDDSHLSVREEFPQSYRDWVCGFASLEQLRDWFEPKWLDRLSDAGFVLRVFELDPKDVKTARFQSVALIRAIERAQDEAEVHELFDLVPA